MQIERLLFIIVHQCNNMLFEIYKYSTFKNLYSLNLEYRIHSELINL